MVTKRPEKRSSLVSLLCKIILSEISFHIFKNLDFFVHKNLFLSKNIFSAKPIIPELLLACVQDWGEGCRCTLWFVSALSTLINTDWNWFLNSLFCVWSGSGILCFSYSFRLCFSVSTIQYFFLFFGVIFYFMSLFCVLSLSFWCPAVYAVTLADLLSDALIHSLCFSFMLLLKGLFAVYASRCSLKRFYSPFMFLGVLRWRLVIIFLFCISSFEAVFAFYEGLKSLSLPA